MSGAWINRVAALAIFGGIEYVAGLLMPLAPRDEFYYAFCVVFNLIEIVLAISILDAGELSLDIIKLCLLQMFTQVIGFVIYECRIPVGIYNWTIQIIVAITFLRIFLSGWIDGNTARDPRRHLSDSGVCLDGGNSEKISQ